MAGDDLGPSKLELHFQLSEKDKQIAALQAERKLLVTSNGDLVRLLDEALTERDAALQQVAELQERREETIAMCSQLQSDAKALALVVEQLQRVGSWLVKEYLANSGNPANEFVSCITPNDTKNNKYITHWRELRDILSQPLPALVEQAWKEREAAFHWENLMEALESDNPSVSITTPAGRVYKTVFEQFNTIPDIRAVRPAKGN